jgi:hypothetical protein
MGRRLVLEHFCYFLFSHHFSRALKCDPDFWWLGITGPFVEGLDPSTTVELIACTRAYTAKSNVKVYERAIGFPNLFDQI